ncbi:hypothetical protein C7974DRAFT_132447 [Boeremia exigua]|uniref:uncharacterized protein n=1 Tax=Boeremia exigua TaxID=749465 RepID=UPI001E8D91FF|nr:uncharacterized protein C7974DRAFT_132447 [Boeremia exigua]KAH6639483.1 hypothetical protein C7974DRAFT_132447 [Boeremia exigua]
MHRSIELGRAVFSIAATDLELWLRTLITISPQQQCTDLGQHDEASLLDILTSGKVWVCRGNSLYIDMEVTFKGQPVAEDQLRQLSEAILVAPVWDQLGLQPSLPHDTASPGKLRITVNYASGCAGPATKPCHRVLASTSAADVRPSGGVPSLSLDSIILYADIFQLTQQRRAAIAKRPRLSADSKSATQPTSGRAADDFEQEVSDELLLEANTVAVPLASPSTLKRVRASAPFLETPVPSMYESPIRALKNGWLNTTVSAVQIAAPDSKSDLHIGDLGLLIDGALRLSVLSRINSKMLPGIKLKANTFELGLADIAPTLWRPGYQSSLSQRAIFLPVIGKTLAHTTASMKITSEFSTEELSEVANPLRLLHNADRAPDCGPINTLGAKDLASQIASRLWLHLQRNTPCKPATTLQSFVRRGLLFAPNSDLDDMLELSWREDHVDDRSGLVTPSAVSHAVEDPSAVPVLYYATSPQSQNLRTVTSDKSLAMVDDELLLGDECFEPLNPATDLSNETS